MKLFIVKNVKIKRDVLMWNVGGMWNRNLYISTLRDPTFLIFEGTNPTVFFRDLIIWIFMSYAMAKTCLQGLQMTIYHMIIWIFPMSFPAEPVEQSKVLS